MNPTELFVAVLADHPAIVAGPAWCLCGWRPTAEEAALPPFARKALHRGHVAAQLAASFDTEPAPAARDVERFVVGTGTTFALRLGDVAVHVEPAGPHSAVVTVDRPAEMILEVTSS